MLTIEMLEDMSKEAQALLEKAYKSLADELDDYNDCKETWDTEFYEFRKAEGYTAIPGGGKSWNDTLREGYMRQSHPERFYELSKCTKSLHRAQINVKILESRCQHVERLVRLWELCAKGLR